MSLGLVYWILLLLWLVLGFFIWGGYLVGPYFWGGSVLQFLLFLILGWAQFGSPVKR